MDATALQLFRGDDSVAPPLPVRGVGWVLRWAGVLAVLAAAAMILVAFAYQLAAERTLARAAAAGLREASLPRATEQTVEAAIRRRLADSRAFGRATRVSLAKAGDRISVGLAVPVLAIVPRWLPAVSWYDDAEIRFRTEGQFGVLLGAR
jgi:hypothetical protein